MTNGDHEATEFLTAEEVADLLRVPVRTVARLLNGGKLPGAFLGTHEGWRVRRSDVLAFKTNRPEQKGAQS